MTNNMTAAALTTSKEALLQSTGTVPVLATFTDITREIEEKKSSGKKQKTGKTSPKNSVPKVKAEIVTVDEAGQGKTKAIVNMVELDHMTTEIMEQVDTISKSFCKIGFYLWKVKQEGLYKARGFKGVGDYAEAMLHFKKSSTSNYIKVCERFSKKDSNGNPTPELDDGFKRYNFTQLSEVLRLPDEKMEEITPEMTVKEIRGKVSSCKKRVPFEPTPEARRSMALANPPVILFDGILTKEALVKVIQILRQNVGKDVCVEACNP